jgi:hypothetical protein
LPSRRFGGKVVRPLVYVVWAPPTHPEKPWARPNLDFAHQVTKSEKFSDLAPPNRQTVDNGH